MCTQEEVKDAIREVLHEENGDGETMIGHEVNKHIDSKFRTLWRWLIGGGIVLIITATSVWTTNVERLAHVEEQLAELAPLTQADGDLIKLQIKQNTESIVLLRLDYKEGISEVKSDMKEIINILNSK